MEIREVITFLAVANLKSFSQAAKQQGYTQAAVTLQIKRLETDLQVSLFNRVGNKVSLTEQGQSFYPCAESMVNTFKHAKDSLRANQPLTGTLTLGGIESICTGIFPELLDRYHQLHPQVNFNIILGSPKKLLSDMNNNLIDIVYFMDEQRHDANWVRVLDAKEDILFATAADSPFAQKSKLTLAELVKHPFILTEEDASYRSLLDQRLAEMGQSVTPFLSSASTSFLVQFLLKGSAVTFLPRFTIRDEIETGRLKTLEATDFHLSIWRQVVYHKHHYLSQPMKAFFQVVREYEEFITNKQPGAH